MEPAVLRTPTTDTALDQQLGIILKNSSVIEDL
jgi:hypothetical protein